MMYYFKNEETGEVFAFDEDQMKMVARINAPDFDNEKEQIPAIFFEIDEKIKSMHKMSAEEVETHTNPPVTREQQIAMAEGEKQRLMSEAGEKISVLQDAVDLDMATPEEESVLKEWKKYRVLLNRVDTSSAPDIDWPVKPN